MKQFHVAPRQASHGAPNPFISPWSPNAMTATAVKKLSWQTTPETSARSLARKDGEYLRWDADIMAMILLLLWERK